MPRALIRISTPTAVRAGGTGVAPSSPAPEAALSALNRLMRETPTAEELDRALAALTQGIAGEQHAFQVEEEKRP